MERDDETGLALHGVRLYAPWLGQLGDGVIPLGLAWRYSIGIPYASVKLVNPIRLGSTRQARNPTKPTNAE